MKRLALLLLSLLAAPLAAQFNFPARANSAAPVWVNGQYVLLSVDLAGNLRTICVLGCSPVGGWLDSVRLAKDTILGFRPNMTHIGRVAVDSSAQANAVPPLWSEGTLVPLSVDLSGNQRITGSVSLKPAQNHIGRITVDSILANQTHVGRVAVDSILANQTHVGRVAVDSSAQANAVPPLWSEGALVPLSVDLSASLRTTVTSIKQNATHVGRVAVDSILANQTHVGRVAVDSILANQTHVGRVAVDSMLDSVRLKSLTVGSNAVFANVSHGQSTGKTEKAGIGALQSSSVTAGQVITGSTITPTNGKTFYLTFAGLSGQFAVISATGTILGFIDIVNNGVVIYRMTFVNPTNEEVDHRDLFFTEPPFLVGNGTVKIECQASPSVTTSILWRCDLGGYEK